MTALRHWLGSLPIRTKLMLFAGLACGLALLLAGIALTIVDYHSGKRALIQRLQTQAEITARNSSAAVAFDDTEAATRPHTRSAECRPGYCGRRDPAQRRDGAGPARPRDLAPVVRKPT